MAKAKEHIEFSEKFLAESKVTEEALKKVAQNIIAETKAKNSYLVVADKEGNIKKIPAKDL